MSISLVALVERAIAETGLDPHGATTLARAGGESHIRKGRPFLWQDDPVERAALVLDGRILPVKHRMGGPDITLPAVDRGEWICLCESMLRIPALADYVASSDTTILAVPARNLELLQNAPVTSRWITRSLARAFASIHSWLLEGGAPERILGWLLSRKREIAGTVNASITATQSQIALELGLSRETVNRRLADLEKRGLVQTGRAEIVIPDWDALSDEATSSFWETGE